GDAAAGDAVLVDERPGVDAEPAAVLRAPGRRLHVELGAVDGLAAYRARQRPVLGRAGGDLVRAVGLEPGDRAGAALAEDDVAGLVGEEDAVADALDDRAQEGRLPARLALGAHLLAEGPRQHQRLRDLPGDAAREGQPVVLAELDRARQHEQRAQPLVLVE